jgi:hypothetical protein
MVDRTSPDTRRAGLAAGRLLVATGLVIAGLFVGTGVSAAADFPVLSPASDTAAATPASDDPTSDTPAIEDPTGCRIG